MVDYWLCLIMTSLIYDWSIENKELKNDKVIKRCNMYSEIKAITLAVFDLANIEEKHRFFSRWKEQQKKDKTEVARS